jgi:nucleoside-diphosphate-sugar epimerase
MGPDAHPSALSEARWFAQETRAAWKAAASRLPPSLAANLEGKSLFLTGCTGLFGKWLLGALDAAWHDDGVRFQATALSRKRQPGPELAHLRGGQWLHWAQGDLARDSLPTWMGCGQPDWVVHAATTSASETFSGELGLAKFDTLVLGTRQLMRWAELAAPRRLLFLSSGVVYAGLPEAGLGFSENSLMAPDPSDPKTALAQAKRASEFLCMAQGAASGFSVRIARCFSFSGPGLPTQLHYAFGNFIEQALFEPELIVQGDGSPLRSYMDLCDLTVWLFGLLALEGPNGLVNVGSDRPLSILELAHRIRDRLAPDKPIRVLGKAEYAVGNVVRNEYYPSVQKARNYFGLSQQISLEESIARTAVWRQTKFR